MEEVRSKKYRGALEDGNEKSSFVRKKEMKNMNNGGRKKKDE